MARSTVARVRSTVVAWLAEHALRPDAAILVAVSGGQDSVCLLDALAATFGAAGGRLVVGHVDHRLRGPESAEDARFVAALAERLGLACVAVSLDAAAYAARQRLGLEEAARAIRYQALAGLAAEAGAAAVATGHTLDDAAEGLLLNLLRGAGPLGLQGIQADHVLAPATLGPIAVELRERSTAVPPLRLLRPLLTVRRAVTEAYCRERGLAFRSDPTNLDPGLARNRVRLHLLPLLRTYNPSVVDALARLARIVGDDEAELERVADQAWRRISAPGDHGIRFQWADWAPLSPALQRRLLRRAARELSPAGGWSFEVCESARRLLGRRTAGRCLALGGAVALRTSRAGFELVRAEPDPARANAAEA